MLSDGPAPPGHERQSLVDLFCEFSKSPREFLQYDNGYRSWKYTYAQVGLAAHHFAARLGEHNIGKGDKVIFWSENRPEWIAAFWGCVLGGVIVVPIDYRAFAFRFLQHVQQIVDARLILIGEEVQLNSWGGQPAVWRLSDLEWATAKNKVPSVRIERGDVAEIVFTSGATGEPKGVLITHGNILANIVHRQHRLLHVPQMVPTVLPLRFLSLIPLSHMFGQVLTAVCSAAHSWNRRLHARIQLTRNRAPDPHPACVGTCRCAQDPQRSCESTSCTNFQKLLFRLQPRLTGSSAGGDTAAYTGRWDGNSGRLWSERHRSPENLRSSGLVWDSRSFKVTDSPRQHPSWLSTTPSTSRKERSASPSQESKYRSRRTARFLSAARV